jgi:penicillin-binding protein 1A
MKKFRWIPVILLGFFCAIIIFASGLWLVMMQGLPSIQELKEPQPTLVSKVLAADGSIIGYFPPGGMVILDDKDIPEMLKKAFISAEDATFYSHAGLDYRRIIAAAITDIRAASYAQGASTITQQVVRTYLLGREKTIYRKVRESVLAIRIERSLTKDQILNLYLNRVYLGSGASGIGAASIRYFNKECKDLTLAEMSLIAGLAPAPARYSPLNSLPAAKTRQHYVLSRMANEGYISKEESEKAYQEPLRITGRNYAMFTRYPYVTDYIHQIVTQKYGAEIFNKGITIKTSIITKLQDAAELAVRKGLIELEMRHGTYRGPVTGLDNTQMAEILAFQKNLLEWEDVKNYELYFGEVKSVVPLKVDIGTKIIDLAPKSYDWIAPVKNWGPAGTLKPGDLVRVLSIGKDFILSQDPLIQSALVAFDLSGSKLVAIVGGVDYAKSQFNRAISAKRQSGSSIKPFIYAAAIDKGYTTTSIIIDAPETYKKDELDEGYNPQNYERKYYGATTLRTGLVMSRNVVTVKILRDIGIDYTLDYLKKFGMEGDFPRDLSLALGTGVVTPYNLTKGFAIFAENGKPFEPTVIDSILEANGTLIYMAPQIDAQVYTSSGIIIRHELEQKAENGFEPPQKDIPPDISEVQTGQPDEEDISSEAEDNPETQPDEEPTVIAPQTAYIITNMLVDAVQYGTATRVKALGRPVAGKTGTSDDFKDAWFIGYTPDMLCGTWVGFDDMQSLGEKEAGGRAAAPIFLDFMRIAELEKAPSGFKVPAGIVFAQINPKTGLVIANPMPGSRYECYKEGSLPKKDEEVPVAEDALMKEVF